MILFWDKNLPKSIPIALATLNLPIGTEYYLKHFPLSDTHPEGGDDSWLPTIGRAGWFVITQDYKLHLKENELLALKQHGIGCFYLWGPGATKWEILRCFARGYGNIVKAAETTTPPFVFWVEQNGKLRSQPV